MMRDCRGVMLQWGDRLLYETSGGTRIEVRAVRDPRFPGQITLVDAVGLVGVVDHLGDCEGLDR